MDRRSEQNRRDVPGMNWTVLGAALLSLGLAVLTASLVGAQDVGQTTDATTAVTSGGVDQASGAVPQG